MSNCEKMQTPNCCCDDCRPDLVPDRNKPPCIECGAKTKDEETLRTLLAVNYAGQALYTDDGELQDNSCRPFIDFLRDPVNLIQAKMLARTLALFDEPLGAEFQKVLDDSKNELYEN